MRNSPLPAKTKKPVYQRAVTVSELCDPTAIGENIEVIAQDVVQLESRPLRARRIVVHLGECTVLFHSTNVPVRARTLLHDGFVAYTAFGPNAVGTVNGASVGPDRILASAAGMQVEFVVEAGYQSVVFLLPPEVVRDHVHGRHLETQFSFPKSVQLIDTAPTAARKLFEWGHRLTELAARQPELFDIPEVQSAAQVEMLEGLFSTLGSIVQVKSSLNNTTQEKHSWIVQTAEDYALSHAADPIYLRDLCEATGVSQRTLQYAFHEVMGMTPMAYLTRLRLHRARQGLRLATHASTTVTKEALRWGFWHFGDFSRSYKDCFGELPSDTLRRPSDEREAR